MSETLKPCPFCGGQAESDYYRMFSAPDMTIGKAVAIYCLQCDADMTRCLADHRGQSREEIMESLTEAWNRRDTELVEALREVTRHLGDAIEWSDLSAHDNYDEVCAAHERASAILRKREKP